MTNASLKHWSRLLVCLLVAALLLAACYLPGLQGNFLFDDGANLPALGAYGPVDNGTTFLRYITSGHADPIGRPLSMLSFLVDARDWPADPYAFKRTNLIIHGVNAILLGLVLACLGRQQSFSRMQSDFAAVLAAILWALHPFFVSTVLYVVQRETMLAATFTLIGMLCWLKARGASDTKSKTAVAWLMAGVGTCTMLAALSKANGLLLPLLVLVCEFIFPSPVILFRSRARWILAPPALSILAYVTWTAVAAIGNGIIPIRGWSVGQRLMTEPSILLDYLAQLWLFKPTDSSVLHDGILVAKSLWDPWYTLPSIVICIGLIAFAWMTRRRYPLVALAILFFFAGHLMESTSLALELYFDHRNYIPAMLMFWPLAFAATGIRSRFLASALAILGVGALSVLTLSNSSLWGNPLAQAIEWGWRHPESARAQAYAVQMDLGAGRLQQARKRIETARSRFSGEPQIALNLIDVHCAAGGISPDDAAYARASFRAAQREPGPLLLNWFTAKLSAEHHWSCPGLTDDALSQILTGAEENPRIAAIAGRRQDIEHVRGLILLVNGDMPQALRQFDRALAELPTPEAALNQAALLGSAGKPALGLAHLGYFSHLPATARHRITDGMPWLHDYVLDKQHYWDSEITHLSKALERDAGTSP
ncbi:tetratricopeptide repeat protein [Luteibacter sp. PvP019]|uniref:tetratricopeptide repeat protein n=1 Tax=Luteibacter sp. PvP019 TaxID=3156436 RepID=UPI00339663DA